MYAAFASSGVRGVQGMADIELCLGIHASDFPAGYTALSPCCSKWKITDTGKINR